jgi:hypothetical protein
MTDLTPKPGAAVYIAPAGSELIGRAPDGTPIAADENGVGKMQRLGTVVSFDGYTFDGPPDG